MKPEIFILSIAISLQLGCENNKQSTIIHPSSIYAGQQSGDSINFIQFDSLIVLESSYKTAVFELDVNTDNLPDYRFLNYGSWSSGSSNFRAELEPLGNNEVLVNAEYQTMIDTLLSGRLIDSSSTWSAEKSLLWYQNFTQGGPNTGWNYVYGFWVNSSDYFIGIRYEAENRFYYGWIKVTTRHPDRTRYFIDIESFAVSRPYYEDR